MKAIFIDRDGVVNRKAKEHEYIKSWEEFEFLDGSVEGLRLLRIIPTFLITNQRGISRGLMTEVDLFDIHKNMQDELESQGAKFTDIYYCPHGHEDKCDCRKPQPGMLLRASAEYGVSLNESYLIDDSPSGIEAGAKVGCTTILISSLTEKHNEGKSPDYIFPDLLRAAQFIRSRMNEDNSTSFLFKTEGKGA